MSDKDKIKEEIERLKDCQSPIVICDTLLQFIDSLPEEPASKEEIEALNDVRHLNPGLDSLYWKLKKS